jgi:hypothetical protein
MFSTATAVGVPAPLNCKGRVLDVRLCRAGHNRLAAGRPRLFTNLLCLPRAYNPRLQVTQMRVYDSSDDVLKQDFYWADSQSQNNGNLVEFIGSGKLPSSGTFAFDRTYTYDDLNRLTAMSSPADLLPKASWRRWGKGRYLWKVRGQP